MRRRTLQTARIAAALATALVAGLFLVSVFRTGGVYGRDGDLLLGVYPGQLRLGWSQDWNNSGTWAQFYLSRSTEPIQLGFVGGNTFTAVAPFEVALDFPFWLLLVPLAASLVYFHRRIGRLPSHPVCGRCGYPVGTSSRCTECGAPLAAPVA